MNQSLYQINTRALLSTLRSGATIDDIPNTMLDSLAQQGFDWVWLLGVWTIGPKGREISRSNTEWHDEYRRTLSDLTESDICGSPFAVAEYSVDPELGSGAALARFRERLEQRGINLLLDFVPNHIGFDHPWVSSRPDFLIRGTREDLERQPDRWSALPNGDIAAYGRDPHFPGWPDTLQLNYFNPQLRAAMVGELRKVATQCSGVRCDMAMLLEPEVFRRTWSDSSRSTEPYDESFWPEAIQAVRRDHPDFLFLAEVYWGYEPKLLEHGFDFTYDKGLYDHLVHTHSQDTFKHLSAPRSYLEHMAHFLENHDEERVATKLSLAQHKAAAVITFFAPGLRFFHHGQLTGSKVKIPVHLRRGPEEESDQAIDSFYKTLVPLVNSLAGKNGEWALLRCTPAWSENTSHQNFTAYYIQHETGDLLVVVNYANHQGQCFVRMPELFTQGSSLQLRDHLSHLEYTRDANDLRERGLYLDIGPFASHVFAIREF